jgi:hypothetical protein
MDLLDDSTPLKRCARCEQWKPISEFGSNGPKSRSKYNSYCRPCSRQKGKEFRDKKKNSLEEVAKRDAYWSSRAWNATTDTKLCPHCKIRLPGADFYPKKTGKGRDPYGAHCRACSRIRDTIRRSVDNESTKLTSARWRETNKEKIRADAAVTRKTPEFRARRNAYLRANPGKRKASDRDQRVRRSKAEGRYTEEDIQRILKLQRGRCAICAIRLTKIHRDHIQPLKHGGTNYARNIQITCRTCNETKQAQDPLVFMRKLGRLL